MTHLLASEVQQLLHNKFVVILGDSVQRTVYKDLVLLLQKDCLLTLKQLKTKGEMSFEQDTLMTGGRKSEMHNGTHYREVRQFCSSHHLVRFYFITRVYSEYLETVLEELRSGEHAPDVVVVNSCLWDLSRYGTRAWRSYLQNLESLFGRLRQVLPESCLLVWNTAMPVGDKPTAKFLPPKPWPWTVPLKHFLVEANFYSSFKAREHGFDVLDLHFHFRRAMWCLQSDDVHWNEHAHRQLSHLLLAHVADAWGVELPVRTPGGLLTEGGHAGDKPEQAADSPSPPNRDPRAFPPPPLLPPPRRPPLLESPPLPLLTPLLTLPPPLLPSPQGTPQFSRYPQDSYFSSDHTIQSDQFFFHSEEPSSTQTGFAFEADVTFGLQPPVPSFSPPWYQQRAPVVYRGHPRYLAEGPYMPWRAQHPYMPWRGQRPGVPRRARPRHPKRRAPAQPEARVQ
ncbi:PC-esterase domain-containing protein 1B [Ctenodactylus gundi]